MAFSLETTQQEVLDFLDALLPFEVEEHAIPDVETVPRYPDGSVKPYVAIQFGDLIAQGSTSFGGPMGDDYILPLYIQVIAPTAEDARRGANKVLAGFLGQEFSLAGSVRKRVGGGQFSMEATNGAIEAYISPLSFGLLVQLHTDVV